MSDKKKSVIEEATLQYEKIEQVMNANSKLILRSLMAEEIENFVNGSMSEAEFEEDEIEDDSEGTKAGEEEMPEIESSEEEKEETEEMPEDSLEIDMGADEEEMPEDSLEIDMGADEEEMPEISTDVEMGTEPEFSSDCEMSPSIDTIDMVGASDEDVISVYKKLSAEDEIEVVSDNEVVITDPKSGSEYTVEFDTEKEEYDESVMDTKIMPEMSTEDDLYEVSMDDELTKGIEEKEEVTETAKKQKGTKNPAMKESVSIERYNTIVKENKEFKKILADFKTKLVETVIFNSNLTYVTKLFMEHSTTQSEKQNILKRFDNDVHSLNESQKLFKTIKNELATKSNISESVDSKLNKIVTNGSSKLNESTITKPKGYADESTKRIIDLFKRVENK
jgi:hypothetical protein